MLSSSFWNFFFFFGHKNAWFKLNLIGMFAKKKKVKLNRSYFIDLFNFNIVICSDWNYSKFRWRRRPGRNKHGITCRKNDHVAHSHMGISYRFRQPRLVAASRNYFFIVRSSTSGLGRTKCKTLLSNWYGVVFVSPISDYTKHCWNDNLLVLLYNTICLNIYD